MTVRVEHSVSNSSTITTTSAASTFTKNEDPNGSTSSSAAIVNVVSDQNPSYDEAEKMEEEEEEEDRKPAAILKSHDGETQIVVDVDHDDHHDDDDDDESMQSQKSLEILNNDTTSSNDIPTTTEDGRPLSEYELLRLERMKRNREYLSLLGLDNDTAQQQPSRKRVKPIRKKENTVIVERRSSITRRTKLQPIQYVGPKSIREMIQRAMQQGEDGEENTTNANLLQRKQKSKWTMDPDHSHIHTSTSNSNSNTGSTDPTFTATTTATTLSDDVAVANEENDRNGGSNKNNNEIDDGDTNIHTRDGFGIPYIKGNRMEIFIFKEFRRLRSEKRQILQKVDRTHRMVQKEMKYWYHQKIQFDRKMKKKLFIDQYVQQLQQQQQMKHTQRDLLRAVDQKMPLVVQTLKKYDQSRMVSVCMCVLVVGWLFVVDWVLVALHFPFFWIRSLWLS